MVFESLFTFWEKVIQSFFQSYQDAGRPILNGLHWFFDNLFHVFLYVMIIVSFVFLTMTVYTFFARKQEQKQIDSSFTPFITVQIPTCNELVAIRCAKKCLEFNYPKNKYEILIGDDSTKSEVSKKLAAFASTQKRIRLLKRGSNKGYKAGNLNHMLKYSKGKYLVIFDSDFIPKKDFLRRIIQPFKSDPKVAGVQARWSFVNGNQNLITTLGLGIQSVLHYVTLPFINKRIQHSFLCGSAEAVRKDVLVKLGKWDLGNLTEDIEYSIRVINNGYKITYLDQLNCDSELPYTAKDFYLQQMRWGYGVIHSFKKHFKAIFQSPHTSVQEKVGVNLFPLGYLFSLSLVAIFITGFLSLITHPPAAFDVAKFFGEMSRNVLLTSGLLIATIVALSRSKNLRSFWSMVVSSFSYGFITTYYVNKGIYKAIRGKPMRWYILRKKGNELYS